MRNSLEIAFPVHDDLTVDQEEAIERMGDREIYLEIAHYFASHLESSLQELTRALENADAETATRIAHSLKGNCATVGAQSMREYCYTMEKLCRSGNIMEAREIFTLIEPKLLALRDILNRIQ